MRAWQTCLLILQLFTRPRSLRTSHSSLHNLFSAGACTCARAAGMCVRACPLRGLTSQDSQQTLKEAGEPR